VALALLWAVALPALASHNGFALPRSCGVPTHIYFKGRQYSNPSPCSGGEQRATSGCFTAEQLSAETDWPLIRVGEVPTLFGPAHPILLPPDEAAAAAAGLTPTSVYVEDNGSCYLSYSLEGGP
jgi:hypothetical protein